MRKDAKEKSRDDRDYDTTSLSPESHHGKNLHRDYTAHFFRWSYARRFIKPTDNVLEVGCGEGRPLYRILATNQLQLFNHYVGVDLNQLPAWQVKRAEFFGGFNYSADWKKLINKIRPETRAMLAASGGFDVAINMEVIEHMKPEHGAQLLKGIFAQLRPGGVLLLSTPCYDGKRHAANHIHEYTVPELQKAIEKAGFTVERRFGTFMDVRHLKPATVKEALPDIATSISRAVAELEAYFDRDAISNFFAPLLPDHARNNLWVCRK